MELNRAGNPLQIYWDFNVKKSDGIVEAFPLEGKPLRLTLITPRGKKEIKDFKAHGNVIEWLFSAQYQTTYGDHSLLLEVLSPTGKVLSASDQCKFIRIVDKSCMSSDNDIVVDGETKTLTLSTEMSVVRIMPVVPEVGENGNWWVDGEDTGKPSTGAIDPALRAEINNKADKSSVPTKTSQLTNDSGFITKDGVPAPDWNAPTYKTGHIKNRTHHMQDYMCVELTGSPMKIDKPYNVGYVLLTYDTDMADKYIPIEIKASEYKTYEFLDATGLPIIFTWDNANSTINVQSFGGAIETYSFRAYYSPYAESFNHYFIPLHEGFIPEEIVRKTDLPTINGQPLTNGGDIKIENGTYNIGSLDLFDQLIKDKTRFYLTDEDIQAIQEGKLITTSTDYGRIAPIAIGGATDVVVLKYYVDMFLYEMYIDMPSATIIGTFSQKRYLESLIPDPAIVSNSLNAVQNQAVAKALEDLQPKEYGKGLSSNDYTNEDKQKLTELSAEIGIVKGYYESNTLIFDKSQIAVGSKIKVSFVLYHPTGKVSVYDAEGKELKGFYITNGTIGQNYTFDSYVLPENYESVKVAGWGELNVEILVESLNPKHIAQSVAELESQVSELKSKPLEIPNKSISAEKLEDYDLLPVFITATNNDLNAIIEELYVFPQYIGSSQIQVRTYSKGIIVGAFNDNGVRLWAVRAYHLADSYKNGELIPLVVGITTSNVAIDTLIGYCVIKDIDALTNASNDSTNGEFVNLSKATQSWLNPKISALRNMPIIENGASESSLITGVDIAIPNEIIAVEGDTLQIFWRSIIGAANPYIFDIYAASSVGKSYPRYFEFKPTSDMSGKSYQMAVYVRANDGTIVAEKTTIIKVVSAMTAPSTTKNILCIGASATAGGQWVGELARRLTATSGDGTNANPTGLGLNNISFVGRKQGTGNPVNLEATGGWRVQDYASQGQNAVRFYVTNVDTLSLGARYLCNGVIYVIQEVNVTEGVGNIRCTLENTFVAPSGKLVKQSGSGDAEITFTSYEQEKFNPFWNDAESRLDFSSYANEYCDGHIDCMIWHCGVNDLSGASIGTMISVIENITTSYRDIFRAYHQQFPNGKVVVSSVPVGSTNGGFAANYGASAYANYFTFAKKVQAYATALSDLCAESEFANYVIYSPVLEEFDAENGYPTKQTAVNNRSSVTEAVGTNGVHPTAEGSYMVADAIYRTFNNLNL